MKSMTMISILFALSVGWVLTASCKSDGPVTVPEFVQEENAPAEYCRIEAEEASLTGGLKTASEYKGYSGRGYVGEFTNAGDVITFNLPAMEPGKYQLAVAYHCPYGEKKNYVAINDVKTEFSFPKHDTFAEMDICKFSLKESGGNTVSISKSWGYFLIDYIVVKKAEDKPFSCLLYTSPSPRDS